MHQTLLAHHTSHIVPDTNHSCTRHRYGQEYMAVHMNHISHTCHHLEQLLLDHNICCTIISSKGFVFDRIIIEVSFSGISGASVCYLKVNQKIAPYKAFLRVILSCLKHVVALLSRQNSDKSIDHMKKSCSRGQRMMFKPSFLASLSRLEFTNFHVLYIQFTATAYCRILL